MCKQCGVCTSECKPSIDDAMDAVLDNEFI